MTEKLDFRDKLDMFLTKAHFMSPLLQFDRYLHRHKIDHVHLPNLIIRPIWGENLSRKFRIWFNYCRLTGERCRDSFDPIDGANPRRNCSNCKQAIGK